MGGISGLFNDTLGMFTGEPEPNRPAQETPGVTAADITDTGATPDELRRYDRHRGFSAQYPGTPPALSFRDWVRRSRRARGVGAERQPSFIPLTARQMQEAQRTPWTLAPKLTPNQLFHKLKKEREELVTKKLAERAERQEEGVVLNKFALGCDPEFVALDDRGRVINGAGLGQGEVGFDHSGRVLEIRPEPSKGAYALVKKIRRLLGDDKLKNLRASKFRAGALAGTDSLGGHIHFGFSPTLLTSNPKLIPALDLVTRLLEHLDILPTNESAERRRGHYGKFGDVRTSHGRDGTAHLEYRTMASWLYDPKVAFLCLTAAKLAACDPVGTIEALKGATSYSKLSDWVGNYRSKDTNAKRVYDKLTNHKQVVVDPSIDFRSRWEEIGL